MAAKTKTRTAIDVLLSSQDYSTPQLTCSEGFLPDKQFKKLTPIDAALPSSDDIVAAVPFSRIVVGLSGVSCGGKTTVAKALSDWLGPKFGSLIMQDDYYLPADKLPMNPITNFPEFDEPESVYMDKIVNDIKKWKNEKSEDNEPRVLVVEGTMIFTCLEIAELCDLRYLIHIDFETAKYRRSLRNYPIPDPPGIVAKNIWPKYIRHRSIFVKLAKKQGLIARQIDGTINVNWTLAGIINDLKINKHSE